MLFMYPIRNNIHLSTEIKRMNFFLEMEYFYREVRVEFVNKIQTKYSN
jgi:hypothetical protein